MLSHNIDNDIEWRQSFMNILISYLNQDVPMPEAVKMKTKRSREQADEFVDWLCEAIVKGAEEDALSLKDIIYAYSLEEGG